MVKWTKVNIPLGQGVDTKTDPKSLPITKLEVLENGVFTDKISIKKRNGYQEVTKSILGEETILKSRALTTKGSELILFDDNTIYGHVPGIDEWVNKGSLYSINSEQKTVASTPAEQTSADFATTGDITAYAWEDSRGGIRVSVVGSTSGTVLVSDLEITSTGITPRCVAFNGHIHVLFVETSSTTLKSLRISPSDPAGSAAGTATTIVTDIDATDPHYDVREYSTYAVFAYHTTSSSLKVGYLALDGSVGSPGGGYTTVIDLSLDPSLGVTLAVHPADGSTYIAYANTTDAYVIGVDSLFNRLGGATENVFTTSPSEAAAITNITAAFEPVTRDDGFYYCQVFYEMSATESWNHHVRCEEAYRDPNTDVEVVVVDVSANWRHVGLGSHAFGADDGAFVNLIHDSSQQSTYMLTKHDGTLVCKTLPGNAGGLVTNNSLPSINNGSSYSWVGIFKNRLEVNVGTNSTYSEKGIKLFTFDFDHAQSHRTDQLGNSTYITGGFLQLYDGDSPVEAGFHLYPENISVVSSNTVDGALTNSGSYEYRCYWEWYTNTGERELSATASGINITLGASDDTVTLTIPTLAMTAKTVTSRSEIRLAVTRTESGGTTRYRTDDPTSPTWNDPTTDTITFTDKLADTVLTSRELDYTNAEYDHIAPPAAEIITATKDRLFLSGFEDPNLIRYSKVHRWGKAISFHDGLQIELDQEGGAITAMAPIDDKVVVFKEQRIFAFTGDGPDDVGLEGDNFPPPQLITSNVGCSNQRSIVQMPLGLMFQTSKGIHLLDRSLKLEYIGADVEAFNNLTITAATLLADKNLVIFLVSSGKTLAYDYYFKQWSTFTNHAGTDAVLWNDTYVYSKASGSVLKETAGYFKDVNSAIVLAMETGWISFESVQGYAKVRRALILGDYKSSHTLQTKIGYNYEDAFSNTLTWVPDDVINTGIFGVGTCIGDTGTYGTGTGLFGGGSSVYQMRIQMPRQKCESVKFRFEDITGDNPGESFELNQLTLEVGVKSTPYKLSSDKTI